MSPMMKQSLTVEYALLGFLWKEPLHGYDIFNKLKDSVEFGFAWRIKKSKLYALLNKLEQNNWLERDNEMENAQSTRKYFRLTEKGRLIFLNWVKSTVDLPRDFRLIFLTKLFFLLEIDPDMANHLIKEQLITCQTWLKNIQKNDQIESRFDKYFKSFKAYHIQSLIDWLDTCLKFGSQ